MSVLSVPPSRLLDINLRNMPEIRTDKPDRFDPETNMSGLSVPPPEHNFEERVAIAEYDGGQAPALAQRIAYQDAFSAVLNTLPYEDTERSHREDWLEQRIKAAHAG
jgi:hypothetical protein